MSSDPDDLTALTPEHFIKGAGAPLTPFPEPDMSSTYIIPLERWKLLQRIFQFFWNGDKKVNRA